MKRAQRYMRRLNCIAKMRQRQRFMRSPTAVLSARVSRQYSGRAVIAALSSAGFV
jgi:hypothetical protein